MKKGKTKWKKRELERYIFYNYYIIGGLQNKQYHCFFQIEGNSTRIRTIYFLKILCTGCSTKKKCHCFFRRAPTIIYIYIYIYIYKWFIHIQMGYSQVEEQNKKTKIITLYILELLFIECSMKKKTTKDFYSSFGE